MGWIPLIVFIYTVLKDLYGWWQKRKKGKRKRRPSGKGKRR